MRIARHPDPRRPCHDVPADLAASEAEFLRATRAGSHPASRNLVEPHREGVPRRCYRMTGSLDDADDLLQETLLRAWRSLGTYRGRGSFRNSTQGCRRLPSSMGRVGPG